MKRFIEIDFSANKNYTSEWIPNYSEGWKTSVYKLASIQINWKNTIENCGKINIELSNDAISHTKHSEYSINTENNYSDALIIDIDTQTDYFRISFSKILDNPGRISISMIFRKA